MTPGPFTDISSEITASTLRPSRSARARPRRLPKPPPTPSAPSLSRSRSRSPRLDRVGALEAQSNGRRATYLATRR